MEEEGWGGRDDGPRDEEIFLYFILGIDSSISK